MEPDEPIKKGYLVLPPSKKTKKPPQPKFCVLFKASKFGIERLEIYETSDTTNESQSKIITLNNCIKLTNKSLTSFRITTKTDVYEFDARSEDEKNEWIGALQSVVFPDDSSKITTIEEDNDLYCPSGEGVFNVKVLSTPASVKCGLDNKHFTLILTPIELELRDYNGIKLFTWPYCFIRKYGLKNGKFTFEAGRKCKSGEGTFLLEHPNKDEIFRSVSLKMKFMKKRLSSDTSTSNTDSEFQAALSMEARSRSPLSLSTASSLNFSEKLENLIEKRSTPPKPPRKFGSPKLSVFQHSKTTSETIPDYEPIDRYDRVEYRMEAWRTLGVDNVNHNETNCASDSEEIYTTSWGSETKQNTFLHAKINNNVAPKIITQKPTQDESYDTLDFFGSSTKLNVNSSYKQVNPSPIAPVIETPSFNEYDEVETCLQGVRLADDSHLGYASIRKEPPKVKKPAQKDVRHQFHNNEAYAVISKPKQV